MSAKLLNNLHCALYVTVYLLTEEVFPVIFFWNSTLILGCFNIFRNLFFILATNNNCNKNITLTIMNTSNNFQTKYKAASENYTEMGFSHSWNILLIFQKTSTCLLWICTSNLILSINFGFHSPTLRPHFPVLVNTRKTFKALDSRTHYKFRFKCTIHFSYRCPWPCFSNVKEG